MTVGIDSDSLNLNDISSKKDTAITQDDLNAWGDTLEGMGFNEEIIALVEAYLEENPDADHEDIERFLSKYDTDGNGNIDKDDADAINDKIANTTAFDLSDIESLDQSATVTKEDADKWLKALEGAGIDSETLTPLKQYLYGVTIDGEVTNAQALALFKELDINGDNDIDAIDSFQIDDDAVRMAKGDEAQTGGTGSISVGTINPDDFENGEEGAIDHVLDELALFKEDYPDVYAQLRDFIEGGADFDSIIVLLEQVAMLGNMGVGASSVNEDDLDILQDNSFTIDEDGKIKFDDGEVRTGISMSPIHNDSAMMSNIDSTDDLMDELEIFAEAYPDVFAQIEGFAAGASLEDLKTLLGNISMLDDNSPNQGLPTMHLGSEDFDFLTNNEFTINDDGTITFTNEITLPEDNIPEPNNLISSSPSDEYPDHPTYPAGTTFPTDVLTNTHMHNE